MAGIGVFHHTVEDQADKDTYPDGRLAVEKYFAMVGQTLGGHDGQQAIKVVDAFRDPDGEPLLVWLYVQPVPKPDWSTLDWAKESVRIQGVLAGFVQTDASRVHVTPYRHPGDGEYSIEFEFLPAQVGQHQDQRTELELHQVLARLSSDPNSALYRYHDPVLGSLRNYKPPFQLGGDLTFDLRPVQRLV